MTVSNETGFTFPFGEYILKFTKADPPEEREFDGQKQLRSTWYFTVVEVIDTEAERDDEVLGKELRKYITIPANGMTPNSNLRKYTEALLGRKLDPDVDVWEDYGDLTEELEGLTLKATWDSEYVPIAGKEIQGINSVSPHKRRRQKETESEPEETPKTRKQKQKSEPEPEDDDEDSGDDPF